jgi:long-subunit fatty acid transport protein
MFGTMRNFVTVVSIDSQAVNRAYEAQFARYTKTGGIYWKAGLMYEHALADSDYSFRLGATFTMSQSLSQKLNYYQISIYNFGDTIVNDTSTRNENQKGSVKLPMTASVGFMFSRANKWAAGFDFQYSNWSKFHSTGDSNMNYGVGNKSYKVALGGEFTPNAEDMTGYFSRVTYRMGLYYGIDYLLLKNTELPFYGLTLGGSFPYRRSSRTHSRLHMAMDIGRLGTTSNGQLKETYFRLSLGLSFNERWFVKAKYD